MEINDQLIDKLADLSRLKFEGEERASIKEDLGKMLAFVEQLNEVNTDDVSPLIYMNNEPLRLRKDEAGTPLPQDVALKNAPSKDSDYFKVPKVLDK